MADTFNTVKVLLDGTVQTIYTCTASEALVRVVHAVTKDSSPTYFSLWRNDETEDGEIEYYNQAVQPGRAFHEPELDLYLTTGDVLIAQVSAADVLAVRLTIVETS